MVRQSRWRKACVLTVAGTALLEVLSMGLEAQALNGGTREAQGLQARNGLQGTWRVEVTLFDCTTGVERAPFWSLLTFAQGGTLTETTSNQALPGVRTPGHGWWSRSHARSYTVVSEAFLLFGPAFRSWTQRITQHIDMYSAEEFTSRATVEFGLTQGTLPPPPVALPPAPGCARATGYRMD